MTPLEECLSREVQARLGDEARELLRKQIASFNLAQRHAVRETCFYSMKKGKPFRDPAIGFPSRVLELKLATIRFCVPGVSHKWTATFFMVSGYFFSIAFSRSPKEIQHRTDVIIEGAEIHQDPMRPGVDSQTRLARLGEVRFHGWLENWTRKYLVADVYEPLDAAERNRILTNLDAMLPPDYLQVVEQCEGFVIGNVSVFGVSQVYEVGLPDWNYHLLAEHHGEGMLGVRAHSQNGRIHYLSYGGEDPLDLGESFRAAVELVLDSGRPRS